MRSSVARLTAAHIRRLAIAASTTAAANWLANCVIDRDVALITRTAEAYRARLCDILWSRKYKCCNLSA